MVKLKKIIGILTVTFLIFTGVFVIKTMSTKVGSQEEKYYAKSDITPTPEAALQPTLTPEEINEIVLATPEPVVERQADEKFRDIAICMAKKYIKIYRKPDKKSKYIGKLYGGSSAKVLDISDDWAKIKSGKLVGHVRVDYLAMGVAAEYAAEVYGETYAKVLGDKGRKKVYKEKNSKSDVVAKVKAGDKLLVTGNSVSWTQVKVDGKVAYIRSDEVQTKLTFGKAISLKEEKAAKAAAAKKAAAKKRKEEAQRAAAARAAATRARQAANTSVETYAGGTAYGTDLQREIVNFALQYVGRPYVWGGESLYNGCDCSGFVMKIYERYGYKLPHSSAAQPAYGTAVSLQNLEPGDLVFFKHGSRIGHVAMYIGNGKIVHAKSKKDGIVVTDVNYRTPYCAARILKEQ